MIYYSPDSWVFDSSVTSLDDPIVISVYSLPDPWINYSPIDSEAINK
jgi:hypothetical protein